MTTPERDPSELRDPALAAAWRALPRDEPPPALDAAILAAAHRAVHAQPREAAAASAPWRWWAPLAAAATIGAIAIGVLQLTPDVHDATTATVSDAPRVATAPRGALRETPKETDAKSAGSAPAPTTPAAPTDQTQVAESAGKPAASPPARTEASRKQASGTNAGTINRSAEPFPTQSISGGKVATAPEDERKQAADTIARNVEPVPPSTAGGALLAPAEDKRKQDLAAGSRQPQPFPAQPAAAPAAAPASPPSTFGEARQGADRDKVQSAPATSLADSSAGRMSPAPASRERAKDAEAAKPASPAPAPPPAIEAQSAASGFARDEPLAAKNAAEARRDAGASPRSNAATAPPPSPLARASDAPAPGVAGAGAAKEEASGKLAQRAAPAAAPAAAPPPMLAKAAPEKARSADDYIATISRLRREGRHDDAARELKAFRADYPDADTRLPPELRGWAVGIAR